MYEQNLNDETWGTPLSSSMGMAVHESQSLFWEDYISRSPAFWDFAWPLAKKHFPDALDGISKEEWILFCNEVKPSLIRVEADEVTYPLHIIARFEIERDIFAGLLQPEDVPGRWNELYSKYLGIDPPDDNRGVLQDVHWSFAYGYFPSYALGKLIAAMWWWKIREELDLDGLVSRGDFAPILDWLRENIHSQGRRFWAPDLVLRVTGRELGSEGYLDYLRHKFYPLYGIYS
jgi:carboxypeptidase Taq